MRERVSNFADAVEIGEHSVVNDVQTVREFDAGTERRQRHHVRQQTITGLTASEQGVLSKDEKAVINVGSTEYCARTIVSGFVTIAKRFPRFSSEDLFRWLANDFAT